MRIYSIDVSENNIYFLGGPSLSYVDYSELTDGALKTFLSPYYFDRTAVIYGLVSIYLIGESSDLFQL